MASLEPLDQTPGVVKATSWASDTANVSEGQVRNSELPHPRTSSTTSTGVGLHTGVGKACPDASPSRTPASLSEEAGGGVGRLLFGTEVINSQRVEGAEPSIAPKLSREAKHWPGQASQRKSGVGGVLRKGTSPVPGLPLADTGEAKGGAALQRVCTRSLAKAPAVGGRENVTRAVNHVSCKSRRVSSAGQATLLRKSSSKPGGGPVLAEDEVAEGRCRWTASQGLSLDISVATPLSVGGAQADSPHTGCHPGAAITTGHMATSLRVNWRLCLRPGIENGCSSVASSSPGEMRRPSRTSAGVTVGVDVEGDVSTPPESRVGLGNQ